nr:AAA family ATPase [Gluconobacter kondonii]
MLVGPNGAGKSRLLLELAEQYRFDRNVTIICNTPHDRFVGLRRPKRLSVGRADHSPKSIVKRAVSDALDAGSEFYQISSILKHCGYLSRFGFRIDPGPRYGISLGDLHDAENTGAPDASRSRHSVPEDDEQLHIALKFLQRHDPQTPIWIDATETVLRFSQSREFASVLRREIRLRGWDIIAGVSVYLQREDGVEIEMQHASSGQLALISSLLFLVTNVGRNPLIIIDEPENSLHPNWQREYVEKVLAAMRYRGVSMLIATHAPLVVTGALANAPDIVSVYEVRDGIPRKLDLESKNSPNSIEEILWRVFDVVTPANHFVSEQIIAAISRFEKRQIEKEEVLGLVNQLDNESFDQKQKRFFDAIRRLIDKVEVARDGGSDDDTEVSGDD